MPAVFPGFGDDKMEAEVFVSGHVSGKKFPVEADVVEDNHGSGACVRAHDFPLLKDAARVMHRVLEKKVPVCDLDREEGWQQLAGVAVEEIDFDVRKCLSGPVEIFVAEAAEFLPVLHWNGGVGVAVVVDGENFGTVAIFMGGFGDSVRAEAFEGAGFDDEAGAVLADGVVESLGAFFVCGPIVFPATGGQVEFDGEITNRRPCVLEVFHERTRTNQESLPGESVILSRAAGYFGR